MWVSAGRVIDGGLRSRGDRTIGPSSGQAKRNEEWHGGMGHGRAFCQCELVSKLYMAIGGG